MGSDNRTYFGHEEVSAEEKTRRVAQVFDSVAGHYDLMNNLMSLGLHHLWKRQAVAGCALKPGMHILDIASGTADMASLVYDKGKGDGNITVFDINATMLQHGWTRMMDEGKCRGVNFVQGDAECLPFSDNVFDCIIIAFGLRNITDPLRALSSMYRTLKYGGRVLILELSQVTPPLLSMLYDTWSFKVIPFLGKVVARDAGSYRYLVESVRRHPEQSTLAAMLSGVGFDMVDYVNLTGGIAAIHRAYKL